MSASVFHIIIRSFSFLGRFYFDFFYSCYIKFLQEIRWHQFFFWPSAATVVAPGVVLVESSPPLVLS